MDHESRQYDEVKRYTKCNYDKGDDAIIRYKLGNIRLKIIIGAYYKCLSALLYFLETLC